MYRAKSKKKIVVTKSNYLTEEFFFNVTLKLNLLSNKNAR